MIEATKVQVQSPIHYRYVQDEKFQQQFFEYEKTQVAYEQRIQDLKERTYPYDELYQIIYQTMASTGGLTEQTKAYLEDIQQHRALFVVGGQQAGLLTGPLYTVHKALTAILLARDIRATHHVAAVPLFWVAGEDHDIEEVNHTYVPREGRAQKVNGPYMFNDRRIVSETVYDATEMKRFIELIFRQFPETEETKPLFQKVMQAMEEEQTYTRFFLRLMNDLFKEEGLLYIDAADPAFKNIQSEALSQMITFEKEINDSVRKKERELNEVMEVSPIALERSNSNLFYVHEGERYLIRRTSQKNYEADYKMWSGTKEDLLNLARTCPKCLSNNVVTRPLMQEAMLPTLAFVAGPGEIAYWALLKEAFHLMELKMPIIEPRLSLTLITRPVQRALKQVGLTAEEVLEQRLPKYVTSWKKEQQNEAFLRELTETKQMLYERYDHLLGTTEEVALQQSIKRNYEYHLKQFTWLENREKQLMMERNKTKIQQFQLIEEQVYPDFQLQERLYSPYGYINQFGRNFIKILLSYEYTFGGEHQILYL